MDENSPGPRPSRPTRRMTAPRSSKKITERARASPTAIVPLDSRAAPAGLASHTSPSGPDPWISRSGTESTAHRRVLAACSDCGRQAAAVERKTQPRTSRFTKKNLCVAGATFYVDGCVKRPSFCEHATRPGAGPVIYSSSCLPATAAGRVGVTCGPVVARERPSIRGGRCLRGRPPHPGCARQRLQRLARNPI